MTSVSSAIRVLIADDHGVYRAGLSQVLHQIGMFSEIAQASNFDDALDMLASGDFALALFDLDMPGMAGPATLRVVRETYPNVTLVVVSAATDAETISAARSAGADEFITKTTSLPDMIKTIQQAVSERAGQNVMPSGLAVAHKIYEQPTRAERREPILTSRQKDVLRCVDKGFSNKEIARELAIAPGTVKIHLAALFAFFDARNRTELAIKSRHVTGK